MTTKSESVWFEQVDRGIIDLVHKVLGKNIPVLFNPDTKNGSKAYTRPSYPYVKVTHIGESFDRTRYNEHDKVINTNGEDKRATLSVSAKPYNLNYQFEIITNKMADKNRYSMLWSFNVQDRHNLDVLDISGTKRNCFMTKTISTTIEEDTQNDDKVYRNIYKYKIRVELDENITYEAPIVTKVNLQL